MEGSEVKDQDVLIRTFLALPLAGPFLEEISAYLAKIPGRIEGVKWVLPQQVHITLHFFGSILSSRVQIIKEIVSPIAGEFTPFQVFLDGVGFFPNAGAPRVIWLGLKGDIDPLIHLQKQMEIKLGKAGFEAEERTFKPHATIGRTRKGRRPDCRGRNDPSPFPATKHKTVDKLVLFQSCLSSAGPKYEVLETFPLSEEPTS